MAEQSQGKIAVEQRSKESLRVLENVGGQTVYSHFLSKEIEFL